MTDEKTLTLLDNIDIITDDIYGINNKQQNKIHNILNFHNISSRARQNIEKIKVSIEIEYKSNQKDNKEIDKMPKKKEIRLCWINMIPSKFWNCFSKSLKSELASASKKQQWVYTTQYNTYKKSDKQNKR